MKKQQTSRKLALLGAGIALAGMTLAGQAQAATLTGSPGADGYTLLGTLHDPGVWIDSGSSIYASTWGEPAASGDVPYNAEVWTKSFILGATDTASSVMGNFGSTIVTPKTLTTVASNTATTWQAGDEIFSIGVVAIDGASSGSQQHLFFGFNSDGLSGVAGGHTGPEWAASSTLFNAPSKPDGNADGGGTGPGDLVNFMVNGSTGTGFDPNQGFVQYKNLANTATQLFPGVGLDAYLAFFNGAQVASNNAYFTTGEIFINKSEVKRDWLALGSNLTPEPFADMIDFSLFYTGNAGGGMWNATAPASSGVFFNVPTTVPEPASIGLLALGAMLLAPRRRKSS